MEKIKMQLIKTCICTLFLYFNTSLSLSAETIQPLIQWEKASDNFSEGGPGSPIFRRNLNKDIHLLKENIALFLELSYLDRNISNYSEFSFKNHSILGYKLLEYKTKIKSSSLTQEQKIYHGLYILKNNIVIGYYLVENYVYEKNQPLVESRVAQIEQFPILQNENQALTLYPNIEAKIYSRSQAGYLEQYALASVGNRFKQLMLEAWFPAVLEPTIKNLFQNDLQQNIVFTHESEFSGD